ncbi:uncharacterized protein LOC119454301 [Dermacentor silvarum]|uniref:uncharacterized protein LOC119454301 n=1 Tax=Dermacentor silvarum TaxID=543639 RepID=UPI002100982C|nr:uncharacterized protein LOC119454301 [Dermacentor silvarum]
MLCAGTEASLAPSGLELLLAAVDCIDGTVPSCATKSPFQEDTHNVTCCSDVDSTSPMLQRSQQDIPPPFTSATHELLPESTAQVDAASLPSHTSTVCPALQLPHTSASPKLFPGFASQFDEYSAASLPSHTCAICPGLQTPPISASHKLLPGSVVQVDGSSSAEVLSTTNVAALHKRIAELEDKLQSHKRRLSVCQRQKNAAVQEKNLLKRRVDQFLGTDQLQCMERPTMRGRPWSTPTIEKGLKIRLTCGRRGYNIVQEIGTPLPSERTLQRHLESFKFSPGILHEILPSLSIKVSMLSIAGVFFFPC